MSLWVVEDSSNVLDLIEAPDEHQFPVVSGPSIKVDGGVGAAGIGEAESGDQKGVSLADLLEMNLFYDS